MNIDIIKKSIKRIESVSILDICNNKFPLTFQLQHGINSAIMKTPRSGPDVAEVTSMDDSMTPSSRPTPKLIPMITNPYTTPIILIV